MASNVQVLPAAISSLAELGYIPYELDPTIGQMEDKWHLICAKGMM